LRSPIVADFRRPNFRSERACRVLFLCVLLTAGCGLKAPVKTTSTDQKSNEFIAFSNVSLVPMTEERVLPAQTVLVHGPKIVAVGPADHVDIPDNALVIDGSGTYLMPGLADMHIHTTHGWQSSEWPVSPLSLFLANGVTTVRDFGPKGAVLDYVLHWRDAIKNGRLDGPTIYACGGILYGPIDNPEEEVILQQARGFDFIKPYSFLSKEEFNIIISASKRLGIYTAGHIPFQVGLDGILEAGMDEIAHVEELAWEFIKFDRGRGLVGYPWLPYVAETGYKQFKQNFGLDIHRLEKAYKEAIVELVAKLRESKVKVCSTLVIDDVIQQKLFHNQDFLKDPGHRYLPPAYLQRFREGNEKHQMMLKGVEDYAPFKYEVDKLLLRALKKQGVPVLLSTDTGGGGMGIVPGYSLHRELQILVENGYTPFEAIAAGTREAGKAVAEMTGVNEFGTVEVGKRADLILLSKNPLLDVDHIKQLRGVMAAGRWYEKQVLEQKLKPGIPITAVVRHVIEANNGSNTQFEIVVGKEFSGKLPNAFDEISVYGPKGRVALEKEDFHYFPGARVLWAKIPETPEIGTYVFNVYGGKQTGLATNTQSVVRFIGTPEEVTLIPANGSVLKAKDPSFSWGKVEAEFPLYYRFEIYNAGGARVYSTGYTEDMFLHTIPDGVLTAGEPYRWRVRVTDGKNWFSVQNRAQSRFRNFSLARVLH